MHIHTLSLQECLDFLRDRYLGHLACSHRGQPYVVPIHFSFDADHRRMYALSGLGQKIQWMRENVAVCLEVDEIRDKDHWTTVLVVGRYRELKRRREDSDERRRAEALLQTRQEWWLPAVGKVTDHEHANVVLYSIDAETFTGRRVLRP